MSSMGEDAAENCDEFGWHPEGDIDPALIAETAQGTHHGYGRAWSRSSAYTLRPDEGLLYLVHTVEGSFDFVADGTTVRTEPGQLMLFPEGAPVHAQTLTDTARYVWFVPRNAFSPERAPLPPHEPIEVTRGPMQALISVTNALLNSDTSTSRSAQEHVGAAIENLILAALDSNFEPTEEHAMHRDGLFTAAQSVIRARFRDPGFSGTDLERDLSTSRSHIHRTFASMGTTPRREIERHRLAEVERQYARILSLDEIVEAAGFTSMRQYRLALARNRRSHHAAEK